MRNVTSAFHIFYTLDKNEIIRKYLRMENNKAIFFWDSANDEVIRKDFRFLDFLLPYWLRSTLCC